MRVVSAWIAIAGLWAAAGVAGAEMRVAARAGSIALDPLLQLPDGRVLDGLALTAGFRALLADDGELLIHDPTAQTFAPLADITSAAPALLPHEAPLYGEHVYDPVAEEFVDFASYVDGATIVPPTVEAVLSATQSVVLLETGLGRSTRVPDNCPPITNPAQTDSGGVDTTAPDGIGDPCQCGDADDNGVVQAGDLALVRDFLADLPPGLTSPGLDKCPVGGTAVACNIAAAARLTRALAAAGPGIAQVCPAATGP